MSFLFSSCFRKKTIEIFFFECFNVFSDFKNYDIESSNKLIISIANINRFRVFHDRKNEA